VEALACTDARSDHAVLDFFVSFFIKKKRKTTTCCQQAHLDILEAYSTKNNIRSKSNLFM
jgi:hypothetical protein